MLKDIIQNRIDMLLNQTSSIPTDSYSYCGLEDSLQEATEAELQRLNQLLAYVEGQYVPSSLTEHKELDYNVTQLWQSHITFQMEALNYETALVYAIVDEKRHEALQ